MLNVVQCLDIAVKRLRKDAVIPQYATSGSACFDLHACDAGKLAEGPQIVRTAYPLVVHTGLAFEIPHGHVMLVFSRSGHGFKNGTRLGNCVGVIDSDYRGEVCVKLTADALGMTEDCLRVTPGDRVAQAMVLLVPQVSLREVAELGDTERGAGGFGSTGQERKFFGMQTTQKGNE